MAKKKAASKKARVKKGPCLRADEFNGRVASAHPESCICEPCCDERRDRWLAGDPDEEASRYSPEFRFTVVGLIAIAAAAFLGLCVFKYQIVNDTARAERAAAFERNQQSLIEQFENTPPRVARRHRH